MWGSTALKKRTRPPSRLPPPSAPVRETATTVSWTDSGLSPAERVRSLLASFGCGDLTARAQGEHIVIEREGAGARPAVARLTAYGCDAFGLAFKEKSGGWEPMLLVDTLEAIVLGVTAVLAEADTNFARRGLT